MWHLRASWGPTWAPPSLAPPSLVAPQPKGRVKQPDATGTLRRAGMRTASTLRCGGMRRRACAPRMCAWINSIARFRVKALSVTGATGTLSSLSCRSLRGSALGF